MKTSFITARSLVKHLGDEEKKTNANAQLNKAYKTGAYKGMGPIELGEIFFIDKKVTANSIGKKSRNWFAKRIASDHFFVFGIAVCNRKN